MERATVWPHLWCPRPLALLTPFLPESGQISAVPNSSVQQSVNMAVDMHKLALPHTRTVLAKRENVGVLSLGGSGGGGGKQGWVPQCEQEPSIL